MTDQELQAVPSVWRPLVASLTGRVAKIGEPFIRDVDAQCDVFGPFGAGWHDRKTTSGDCDTDGHYMCAECIHISIAALRHRRDECGTCGTKLKNGVCLECDR